MRRLLEYFQPRERELDPQTYAQAKDMLNRLESANHRLALMLAAHRGFLEELSRNTEEDHMTAFNTFFLNNREIYTDETFTAFKQSPIITLNPV